MSRYGQTARARAARQAGPCGEARARVEQRAKRRMARRRAFTLIEMLTTVAVLIIVLGLMVSLARFTRANAEKDLTQRLLAQLQNLHEQYARRYGPLPAGLALPPEQEIDEATLQAQAWQNNQQVVRTFRGQFNLSGGVFSDLPVSVYDEVSVRDAWGSPILFLPAQHPRIGMAPGDEAFFFSAGPDRRYLTREDNLYSYEIGGRLP